MVLQRCLARRIGDRARREKFLKIRGDNDRHAETLGLDEFRRTCSLADDKRKRLFRDAAR